MPCTILVGGFFGDEGKGKIASYLAREDAVSLSARGGVGPNAGHSILWKGTMYKLRMLASAFVNPKTRLLLGPGVLVNPEIFLQEVETVHASTRTGLDPQCAIIEEKHVNLDKGSAHLSGKIGSTGTGCGPCNVDRVSRVAKLAKDVPELKMYLTDVPYEVNEAIDAGKNVLIEGTQGTFLSLFHGTYPYVTSKDVTASSIAADVGIGPKKVDEVLVVFKAFVTRVGGGPLEGLLSDVEAESKGWSEVATVTGRARRSAPFNFDLAKRAVMLNGATQAAITKFDIIFPESRGQTVFEELPTEAITFVEKVEYELGIPVTLLGIGPAVEEVIDRRSESAR